MARKTTVKMPGKGVAQAKASARPAKNSGKKVSSVHQMTPGGKVNTY
jgi:hypothetical protein